MNQHKQNYPAQQRDSYNQHRSMQEPYAYKQEESTPKKGHGFKVAIAIEIVLLIALIVGGVFLVFFNQPKPLDRTSDMEEMNGNGALVVNDKTTLSETQQTTGEEQNDNSALQMPVDKIILPYGEEVVVKTPGKLAVSQVIGTERIAITDVDDILPNIEINISESSDKLVQNGTYEVRMEEPIILDDGRRLSFHAYIIDYRWERIQYLHNMDPSKHDLYVLADGENPDMAELIQSGVAARTKNDTAGKGDKLVEAEKSKNLNENIISTDENNNNNNKVTSENTIENSNEKADANKNLNEGTNSMQT